jgi:GST-like protein
VLQERAGDDVRHMEISNGTTPAPRRHRDPRSQARGAVRRRKSVIHLHYWPTPNGHKITLFLEEAELPYEFHAVNLSRGDQFNPDYLKISPNNRMPAIIDDEPAWGGAPIGIFESGAILVYLSEKSGRFLPKDLPGRFEVLPWLFLQAAALGPTAAQINHFVHHAPEEIPYAIGRFVDEMVRLYGVLERRLVDREFIGGAYSIADMACYPLVALHEHQRQQLADFPNLTRWLETIKKRPATICAYARGRDFHHAHLAESDKMNAARSAQRDLS